MQRTDRIRGYDSRCRPFELNGLGAVTPSLLHGLTQQDRVVEHQADRPDPATANECLWIGVRPKGWTGLGGSFDRLPSLVVLELRGAQVAER